MDSFKRRSGPPLTLSGGDGAHLSDARLEETELMHQIRNAGLAPNDADFIVAAFDSSLPVLMAAGNAGQWGTTPFSEKIGFLEATKDDVAQSERFRLTGEGERLRLFIAQTPDEGPADSGGGLFRRRDDDGKKFLSVGAVMVRDDEWASHIISLDALASHRTAARDAGGFVFLDVLVSDHRVGQDKRGGSGLALIEHVKEYAKEKGKRAVYVDCWTGGTDSLVRYYERAGFEALEDFEIQKKDGSVWPGRFFRLDL